MSVISLGPLPRARAQEASNPPPTPASAPTTAAPTRNVWYGWQTLAVDGASIVVGVLADSALNLSPPATGTAAATWYGMGAVFVPAVHYAHGNDAGALASFGFRLLVPPLTATIGLLASCLKDSNFKDHCTDPGLIGGSLVGLAGVAAADALLFAREDFGREWKARGTRYGWQIMTVDAIGYGAGIAFAATHPRTRSGKTIHPALAVWTFGYTIGFIGAPIVHFVHGEVGTGFGSLGLRLLAGPAGALPGLIGFCAASGGTKDCIAQGAQWGLLGGAIAASLLDAFVLARESERDAHAQANAPTLRLGLGTIGVAGVW